MSQEYHESEYDKQLRHVTVVDTVRTIIITVFLFVLQYIVFLNSSTLQALLK